MGGDYGLQWHSVSFNPQSMHVCQSVHYSTSGTDPSRTIKCQKNLHGRKVILIPILMPKYVPAVAPASQHKHFPITRIFTDTYMDGCQGIRPD